MKASSIGVYTLAALLLLVSCRSPSINIPGEHRVVPRSPKWTIGIEDHIGTASLDFECAYVAEVKAKSRPAQGSIWYRFWPDGHVARRNMLFDGEPDADDLQSLEWCDIGYFTFKGNTLLIELYMPHFNYGRFDYYCYIVAEVSKDSLTERKFWWRGHPEPPDQQHDPERLVFRKVPAGPTPRPDW